MVPVLQSNNFRGRGGKTSEEAAGREPSIMRQGRAMSTMQECSGMIPAHYILELLGSCDPPTSFSKIVWVSTTKYHGLASLETTEIYLSWF
ncbi:protein PPP5D1-like isoform X5 [Macaca nemestrina]|uniref:protein PPP5D1-like isoform X5 n=1 Tax=Macaca nemestrina TaxID=9545 RepID=UPI0039B915BF